MEWADAGRISDFAPDAWRLVTVTVHSIDRWRIEAREETVYVRRRGADIEAMSPVCPHTGCLVRTRDGGFECPCHRSVFDPEGNSLEGPSPRPLDRLEVRQEKGRIKLLYRRFRTGVVTPEAI